MASTKLKVGINEARSIIAAAGIPMSNTTLADGIATGIYPFGRVVRVTETGRRTFEIFRVDLLAWIDSKRIREGTSALTEHGIKTT